MPLVAAVDLGTTTARAGLFDETGRRLRAARRRIATSHPFPGAVEQDPVELVSVVVELLGVVIAESGSKPVDVAALGIANQRATVVAWDAATGAALRPAIGWQDTRTASRVAEFVTQGIPLTTAASCSKLEWLVASDDTVAAAAASATLRVGTVDSWLTWALTGGDAHVTDPSNAGATGLLDLRSGDWSDGALGLFNVPREPLATVVASDAVVGTTLADLVGAEIPLAARVGDQQAACIAHGIGAGDPKLTLGTSAMLDVGSGPTPIDAPAGTYALPLSRRTVDGREADDFMVEASVQTAGAVIEWLVGMGLLAAVEELDETVAAGTEGPLLVPALAGLGSPLQDPSARGLLSGIGLGTTPADVVGGCVRGIAERVTDLVETLAVEGPLPVDGGLSRSPAVLQAIASATGLAVVPAADPETTLLGAAMLAAGSPHLDLDDLPPTAYGDPIDPGVSADERAEHRRRWRTMIEAARTP